MPAKRPPAPPGSPATILDLAFNRASESVDKPLVRDSRAVRDIEFVCRCSNQAGTRFLLACLVAKLSDPALDIRKPYTEIGGAGVYSGRSYDEVYVAPFAFKHNLPVNATSAFLTPAFRTNMATMEPGVQIVGRPKQLYVVLVGLITAIHEGALPAENVLAEIVRWLLIIREERRHRIETLSASLRTTEGDSSIPAEGIVTLIQQHMALPRSSRLPVLVVAAAYQAAQEHLGERCLALRGHNAADKQTGALGDIEIALQDDGDIVTAYEMKAKRVTREDIDIALQKLAAARRTVENYIFVTTDKVDEDVREYAAALHERTGVEFVILDCIGFLRHFIHLFYRIRMQFLEAYQALVMSEPDSAVNPALKEAFLTLRLATETGVTQPIEGPE
ncbi:MAG: restriction endonuclease, SacI family [Acidobacteriota bacterium]|nr:restriction endonuclease, SacI family [Acidobacteriota bacterium]